MFSSFVCSGAAFQTLYAWIIALIFYRYAFFVMSPGHLAPPYWINMGAAGVSTLAGTALVAAAAHSPVLSQILPFVRGMTLLWWATATWWIPMLLILGVWRHVLRKFPVRYDPFYWGAVFPVGMYTVATARLSAAIEAPFLATIAGPLVDLVLVASPDAEIHRAAASIRPVASSVKNGHAQPVPTFGGRAPEGDLRGYSVHAGVAVRAGNETARRRVIQYCARPPFAEKQVSLLPDGRVAFELRHPGASGETHVTMRRIGFVTQLAALIPPPRQHQVRYFGVLASASPLRAFVVPHPQVRLRAPPQASSRASIRRRWQRGEGPTLWPRRAETDRLHELGSDPARGGARARQKQALRLEPSSGKHRPAQTSITRLFQAPLLSPLRPTASSV